MRRPGPLVVLMALAAASAVLVVGCGGPSSPDPAPRSSVPTVPSPSGPASPSPVPSPSVEQPPPPPAFDRARLSVDDPTSLWVVSDKLRPLQPLDYVPPDLVQPPVGNVNGQPLRAEAAAAVASMFAASVAEGGGEMRVQSAYRSYEVQQRVYAGSVASNGQAVADALTARAGFSEHQTGLAVDISPVPVSCVLQACFATTPQGAWLAANSWRYGFVLRYPADKTDVTGFTFEPWHFRYVGVELATEMHGTGITTLEEFFGLPAAPAYAP